MRIIAFAGPKGSGKDTAARYLLARNTLLTATTFRQNNFAESLKLSVELIFGFTNKELNDPALKEIVIDRWPFKSPREILQNFANLCRTMYAQDIWVRAWERRIKLIGDNSNCIIVTDLRHIEEVEKLRELGAKIIYVHNPKIEELRMKGIEAGDPLWCDSSEALAAALRKEADAEIENDGVNLQDLYVQVHHAVLGLYPEWLEWQELSTATPTGEVII